MIDCKEALEKLYLYLDRHETDEMSATEIEEHLDVCRDCFQYFEFEKKLKARVRACCDDEKIPEALTLRIQKILTQF
jgi:mycothiol system anti-sigma-R factor